MKYYMFTCGEDGIEIAVLSKGDIEAYLAQLSEDGLNYQFIDYIPPIDKGYWDENYAFIIKGDVIQPQLKQFVTRYEVA